MIIKNKLKDEINIIKNNNKLIFDKDKINNFTNILLIDGSLSSYDIFYKNVNKHTLPIIYKKSSIRQELIEIFISLNKSSIDRIAFVFDDFLLDNKKFINNESFFNDNDINYTKNYSDNFNFMINLINNFNIKNIDFLVCNSLLNKKWRKYYDLLNQITNVTVGASNDKTGNLKYGGNWIMETTNIDVRNIYFNDGIEKYNSTLVTSTISSNTTIYNSDIPTYIWPIYINGISPITVTFGDNLTLNDPSQYFIIACNNVTIDGNNKTVNFDNVQNYIGLVTLDNSILYDFINIKNINTISTNNSILSSSCGWIATSNFSGATECIIQNCNNSANISDFTGGICGKNAGFFGICNIINCSNTSNINGNVSGGITNRSTGYYGLCNITNCSNTGNVIGVGSGGISVDYSGEGGVCNISNCSNSGDIIGIEAGGITSSRTGYSGVCNINNCYNSGEIIGENAGGITSKTTGYYGECNINYCYNTGNIITNNSGGITSSYAGYLGVCNINNCYNIGNIKNKYCGGISGSYTGGGIPDDFLEAESLCNIINCYNTGNIDGEESGGIVGFFAGGMPFSSYLENRTKCNIENCFNTGVINGYFSGGITGSYPAGVIETPNINISECNIFNCYNNGKIKGPGGGGITGAHAGAAIINDNITNNKCNIENCYNIGKVKFNDAGGICGFIGIDDNFVYNININNCYTLYCDLLGYNSLPLDKLNLNISNIYLANGEWENKKANKYLKNYSLNSTNSIWTIPSPNVNNLPYLLTSFKLSNNYIYSPNYLIFKNENYGESTPLNVPNTLSSTIISVNNKNNKKGIEIENNNGTLLFKLNKINGTYEIYTLTITNNGQFNITPLAVKHNK
jgi:hypothetical protein